MPTILIEGETGTGKGLVAHALHAAGPRASGPFVDVNCAAIPATLLESEMFGVERGAFTDARQSKPGLFQLAHRGTIFLDEIGLLPEALQAKLLKAAEPPRRSAAGGLARGLDAKSDELAPVVAGEPVQLEAQRFEQCNVTVDPDLEPLRSGRRRTRRATYASSAP